MSNQATQANRLIRLETPLGEDVLLLRNFRLGEELGRPFELFLDLQSEDSAVDLPKVLGQAVTVSIELPAEGILQNEEDFLENRSLNGDRRNGAVPADRPFPDDRDGVRYINGYVTEISQVTFVSQVGLYDYRAKVVPWLSLLDVGADCRIFQNMTVPDIVMEVFRLNNFSAFRSALTGQYRQRPLCVQYRESAFGFVSRLLEEEGIYYFFEHHNGSHTLVLADGPTSHGRYPGYRRIGYNPREERPADWEHVHTWRVEQRVQPGLVTNTDYDYTQPRAQLLSTSSAQQEYGNGGYEFFDAPGRYSAADDPSFFTQRRLEAYQCRQTIHSGEAVALGMLTGWAFRLHGMTRSELNDDYLLTVTELEVTSADFTSRDASVPLSYQCHFQCQALTQPFRLEARTPKPRIDGVQTAVVTGPEGTDPLQPFTDAYGNVRLHFWWDRHGKMDDTSSPWVRVSQISAGPSWGSMFIPRIGNEVIVAFIDGDPDRPIVVGRVYNANAMPALPLPAKMLYSYICDDGANAIALYPEPGKESILLYSQHNNSLETIGAHSKP